MIYVTGDVHGWKENIESRLEKHPLLKGDILIVVGDFGFPWDPLTTKEGQEQWAYIRELGQRDFTLCFIDGNHENYDILDHLPTEERWGGLVHNLEGVYHLLRGEVYTIEGHTIFTFGGATSMNRGFLQAGVNWWARENASKEEKEKALRNLEKYHWKVDYVITHQAPQEFYDIYKDELCCPIQIICTTQWFLDKIAARLTYKKWYFGHYHIDENRLKARVLLSEVVPLGE